MADFVKRLHSAKEVRQQEAFITRLLARACNLKTENIILHTADDAVVKITFCNITPASFTDFMQQLRGHNTCPPDQIKESVKAKTTTITLPYDTLLDCALHLSRQRPRLPVLREYFLPEEAAHIIDNLHVADGVLCSHTRHRFSNGAIHLIPLAFAILPHKHMNDIASSELKDSEVSTRLQQFRHLPDDIKNFQPYFTNKNGNGGYDTCLIRLAEEDVPRVLEAVQAAFKQEMMQKGLWESMEVKLNGPVYRREARNTHPESAVIHGPALYDAQGKSNPAPAL